MRIIIPPASIFRQIVGKQKRSEGQTRRLMTYVIQYPVENGVLFYHTLTCCMVLLTHEEAAHIADLLELMDLWFVVPDEHDDRKFCEQVRKLAGIFQPPAKRITGYTILTTTGCNARCFYCYEKGTKVIDMTAETAEKVVRYIMTHRGEEKVKIKWFGGEPLFNVGVIDQICAGLSHHQIPFQSSMISNGLLFDAQMVRRAKDLWQLQQVQITIDGLEETYNRVKNFVHCDESAFLRIISNIGLLTSEGIDVSIRLNVDKHNIDEMSQLVSLLNQQFGSNERLSVYSHELFGERSPEDRAFLYEQRMLLEQKIVESGFKRKRELQKDIKLNHCMADNDNSVVISPDGHLGKCEHFCDREFFGHIDSEQRDEAILRKFKERPADIEACATCPYYPQCFRLVMCENGVACTPEVQKENLYNTIEAMKAEYLKYLNTDQHETEI